MTEQPPGEAFRVTRRGYDRDEVDARLGELHARLGALEDERNQLAAELAAVGVESPAELRSELEAVAADVGRVLEAARQAADAMRSRAAEDAARWREAAQAEADDAGRRAEHDAMALRGDAWQTGTDLLQQVGQQTERIRAAAEQDAILTRAEAEQEAHRLVASARKDIADESRLARLKAERMTEEARIAGEQLMSEAHREVDAAQERVRDLEQRRAELMREIDVARDAVAELHAEIDERRSALEPDPEPEPAPVAPAVEEPARPDWAASWAHDEVTVRIVPQAEPAADAVDALAMAAEVAALRQAGSGEAGSGTPEPEEDGAEVADHAVKGEAGVDTEAAAEPLAVPPEPPVPEPLPAVAEVDVEPEPAVEVDEPEAAPVAAAEPEPAVEAVAPEVADEPAAAAVVDVEPEAAAEVVDEADAGADAPPAEAVGEAEGAPGGIDDLFDRLRGGGGAVPAAAVEPVAAAEPEPQPAPAPVAERPPLRAVPAAAGPDPFELRDRLLLPLTNKALREAKRVIVDVQNVVLQELRTSGGEWTPEPDGFAGDLAPTLAALLTASRSAGALAAAELTGAGEPPTLDEPAAPPGLDLRAAIGEGLGDVLRRSRDGGAGPRQQSAAVSRYFRAWRTDETERRLRHAAMAAFHGGLVDACAALGVPAVEGRANGRVCAACPASTGQAWVPGDPPPDGTTLPPAHDDCSCTVVPRPA